jgi:LmbE family N-acetylglucosaminyl deacetylase
MRSIIFQITLISLIGSLKCQTSGYYLSPSNGEIALNERSKDYRILYLAAHPDDENTRLIAHWSKYNGYDVAYLSLTRGEGGQNMIGPELGEVLGVIRSKELFAARKIDGAKQFFGGALDFGYSKTTDETLDKWNEAKLLNRIESVIMEFKPDVIVTRFPPDKRAGHGHHSASAVLALKAFHRVRARANDAGYYPKAVYWNTSSWWLGNIDDNLNDSIQMIKIGGFIPEIGKSSLQIGTQARGMHKSQGFAGKIDRGFRKEYLMLLSGESVNWSDSDFKSNVKDLIDLKGIYVDFKAKSPNFVEGESLDAEIEICLESDADFSFKILNSKDQQLHKQQRLKKRSKVIIPLELMHLEEKSILFKNEQTGKESLLKLWPDHIVSDRVLGELRRPVQNANSFSISYSMPCIVFIDRNRREVDLSIFRWGQKHSLNLDFEVPKGWNVKTKDGEPTAIRFLPEQNVYHLQFYLEPSKDAQSGELIIRNADNGKAIQKAVKLRYDHIPNQEVWLDGSLPLRYIPMELPKLRIGYIKGVGDDAPMAMRQMGMTVVDLDASFLTNEALKNLDALVIGIRAYNVNQGLKSSQDIIDDYVSNGGHLVIQYNTASRDRVLDKIGPVQFSLSRDRVTIETIEPNFLVKSHVQMKSPNQLNKKDFEGWVQERGLYFADSWDSSFVPLISWSDPGETQKRGVWIVSEYGKGTVTYCGLSLFRQWREGVPGAYRILANLVGHGK